MSLAQVGLVKKLLLFAVFVVLAQVPQLSAETPQEKAKQLTRSYQFELNSLNLERASTNANRDLTSIVEGSPPQAGDCYPDPIPTAPEGPTVKRNLSWFDDQFEMTAWRLACSEENSHVIITIKPVSPSAFICSSQLTVVQNGIQNDRDFQLLQDPDHFLAFCGNVYVETSLALDHYYLLTPNIDLQKSFEIYWDLGDNLQRFTMFAYDPSDYGIGGEPPPSELANDAGVNGLFYDPDNPGHGFDIVRHEGGLIVYYYGHSATGERLWLISDNYQENLNYEDPFSIDMYEIAEGTFGHPAQPASKWGSIDMTFSSCDAGQAMLTGNDGTLAIDFVRLAAIPDTSCE